MRFQNWLLEENLINEAVEFWVMLESIDKEELFNAYDQAKKDPSKIGDFIEFATQSVKRLIASKLWMGFNNPHLDDILQDFAVNVLRNLQGSYGQAVTEPETIVPWLITIAINARNNFLKKKQHRTKNFTGTETDDRILQDPLSAMTSRADSETFDAIEQAMKSLSEKHREILKLFYFDHLPHEEIVKKLDIPIGTSKSRLNQAKAQLKIALKAFMIGRNN
jgi:RNA polymerase sigma-70 factor (ECF subfamily)